MLAEEAVGGLEGVLRDAVVLLQQIHGPRGMAVLQAVTVGTIPHQLAVMQLPKLVDLPINDGIVLGTAKAIAPGGMNHLTTGEQP